MSLKLRLSRGGTKKRPFYRIVVADTRAPRDGRYIERLGTYDPMLPKDHENRVILKADRIKHWLSVGALPTDRVSRFLAANDLGPERKIPEQTKKHLPGQKAQERVREKEEKAKAVAEAAAAAAEEAKAAAKAPVEEAPAEETPAEEEAKKEEDGKG